MIWLKTEKKHATNLENVYLNENFLEQIPIDILENPNIKVLDLEHNNLQNSTDVLSEVANHKLKSGPSHLTTINLKNNENLGELSDLYHSDNSWYYKYNQLSKGKLRYHSRAYSILFQWLNPRSTF